MRSKAKTSPVIRATLAANEAVDRLHNVHLAEAKDDEERERIQRQHHDLILTLAAILHEAQFGPPAPPQAGPRLVARDARPVRAAPPRIDTNPVYQLKVTLRDSRPPIWRRIQVRGNTSLSRLHDILQIAMGWTDSHLHEFVVNDVRYGFPDMEWDPWIARRMSGVSAWGNSSHERATASCMNMTSGTAGRTPLSSRRSSQRNRVSPIPAALLASVPARPRMWAACRATQASSPRSGIP